MKASGFVLLVAALTGSPSVAFAADTDPCAVLPAPPKDTLAAIRLARTNQIPELVPTTKILPAGTFTEVVIQNDFDSQTTYRAIIEGRSVVLLYGSQVSARRIPTDHSLVKSGVVTAASTLVMMQIPSELGSAWSDATVYLYGCMAGNAGPTFVSSATIPVSYAPYSSAIVWAFLILVYFLIALAAKRVDKQNLKYRHYLDPVVLTAGPNGKGNLAKLQILFFSMIVVGLVGYIVCRTGILSDLSSTILILLGIAGVGSATAKATDVNRNRLDFENWAWFIRKEWLPEGGLAAVNQAKWADIVTTDGEFDVYHFQNLIFSVVVGGALIIVGLRDLASFSIPEALLGILGLSQVVYIGGKLVAPPKFSELNTATSQLRDLERDFVGTASRTPDPTPPAGSNPLDPPATLDAAIRRAGHAKYDAYVDRVKNVRVMFNAVTGQKVDDDKLAPALTF